MENRGVTVTIDTIELNITPAAFKKYARDFLSAAKSFSPANDHFSPVPYYLYCHAMELAMKTFILVNGYESLDWLKTKGGHNLEVLLRRVENSITPFTTQGEKALLQTLGAYYNSSAKDKGFEYINLAMLTSMLRGLSDLPPLKAIDKLATRIDKTLLGSD